MPAKVMRASSFWAEPKYRKYMRRVKDGYIITLRTGNKVVVSKGTLLAYIGKGRFARAGVKKKRRVKK